jgi:hypothetical protein
MGLFDLFKPGWRRSSPKARQRAIERAGKDQLEVIALRSRHEDTFLAAVSRLPANYVYAVLHHLTHQPQRARQTPEVIRRRRRMLVEKLDDGPLLETVAAEFDQEIALLAVAKMNDYYLARALAAIQDEAVQQAAFARITSQNALLQVAWDCPSPALRQAALRKLTSIPALLDVIFGGNHVKSTVNLRRRLEELVEECLQRKDWASVKPVIARNWFLDEKSKLMCRLPASEIDLEDLRTLAKGSATVNHTYYLVKPVLETLEQGGWKIERKITEQPCPHCGATGTVDESYGCRACAGKGVIRTVAVTGANKSQQFQLTVLD